MAKFEDELTVPFWFRGSTVTALAGIESPEPPSESGSWSVKFVVAPNDAMAVGSSLPADEMMGDSNFVIPAEWQAYLSSPAEQPVDTPIGQVMTAVVLHKNEVGRLGRVDIDVREAKSSVQAYLLAKTTFDHLNLRISLKTDLSLKVAFCHIQDGRNPERFAIRYTARHPVVQIDFDDRFLPPVLQRMAASYVEALTTNSHFYSFLCRYKLVDALTNELQRAFRLIGSRHAIVLEDLCGRFTSAEVGSFLPELVDQRYRDCIVKCSRLRVRVAHLLTSVGFHALNAASQEDAEMLSQALHIAAHNLLHRAIDNYQALRSAGVSAAEIDANLAGGAT